MVLVLTIMISADIITHLRTDKVDPWIENKRHGGNECLGLLDRRDEQRFIYTFRFCVFVTQRQRFIVRDEFLRAPSVGRRVRHHGLRVRVSAAGGRRIRGRRTDTHVPHYDAGPRQRGTDIGGPVSNCPVRKRHQLEGSRYAHRSASQRLFRRVPDPSTRPRVRRECRRIVRSSAAGLTDARLQRNARK